MRGLAVRLVAFGILGAMTWTARGGAQPAEAPPPVEIPTVPVPQVLDPIPPPGGGASPSPKTRFGPAPPSSASAPRPAASVEPPPAAAAAGSGAAAAPAGSEAPSGTSSPTPGPTTPRRGEIDGVFRVVGAGGPRSGAPSGAQKTGRARTGGGQASGAIVAEWPGFRMLDDGSSEVMVEFSRAAPAPTERHASGTLRWVFRGVQVPRSNNRNPLLTRHFNTPVVSARLVPQRGELHLIVELRSAAGTPSTGFRAAGEGAGQQFFVRFPAGTYRLPEADEPTPRPNVKASGPLTAPSTMPTTTGQAGKVPTGPLTGPKE